MRNLSKYANDYTHQPFDETHLKFRRVKLLEQIKKYRHERILEISCGKRPFFQDYTDFEELVIVEPTKPFFDNASELLRDNSELKSKVIILNDLFENTIDKIGTNKFDFVILSNVLQEIEDVPLFLKGLHKVCRKNTIIHIVVPNANSFHRLLALEMGIINSVHQLSERNILLQQQITFDLKSLEKLIVDNGFSVLETGSSFLKPFTHQQMHEMQEQNIINEKILHGLYKMVKYMPDFGSEIFIDCQIS